MNTTALLMYFSIKKNRQVMIDKIDNGFKNKDIKIEKDEEVEKFNRSMMVHWENLMEFEPTKNDILEYTSNGLTQKQAIKKVKSEFCDWIGDSNMIKEGYSYGYNKKEQIKHRINTTTGNIKSKIKSGLSIIIGKKVGRNDLCPCSSGIKYKKCCINKKVAEDE